MPGDWKEELYQLAKQGVRGGVESATHKVFLTTASGLIGKSLNTYESQLRSCVYQPDPSKSVDIAGLDDVMSQLVTGVIAPLVQQEKYSKFSPLLRPPTGVLLHGPPGTGKTTIAKMIAQQSGVKLLIISPSQITSKWTGESERLVSAMFSFARKLKPCIIFIDEIDSVTGVRYSDDESHGNSFKAEFLAAWEGIDSSSGVLILGATNRAGAIDDAFLSRMSTQIYVGLPIQEQRVELLKCFLEGTKVASDLDYKRLAGRMEGYSGRDIKHCCEDAVMTAYSASCRPVATSDFSLAQPVMPAHGWRQTFFGLGV